MVPRPPISSCQRAPDRRHDLVWSAQDVGGGEPQDRPAGGDQRVLPADIGDEDVPFPVHVAVELDEDPPVGPGEVGSAEAVPVGSGAVIRRGLHKVAVHRDEQGQLHELTATCPHLGCIVAWNDADKTWDCPCHGSRFDRIGKVLNGPANQDLARVDDHEGVPGSK